MHGTKQTFNSKLLNEDRPLIISFPNGYNQSNASYPVLYLTDGLQNFWHTIGTIEVLTRTGNIVPMIVVGIESTNRLRDFTLTKSTNFPDSGGGLVFLDFIENELIPYIDSTYRTNSYRILEGHSLGGLFVASSFMSKPSLFNSGIILSPSFWWDNEELTNQVPCFFENNKELSGSLFFGIGKEEGGMTRFMNNFINSINLNQNF